MLIPLRITDSRSLLGRRKFVLLVFSESFDAAGDEILLVFILFGLGYGHTDLLERRARKSRINSGGWWSFSGNIRRFV